MVDRLGKKRRASFRRRILDRRLLSIDPKVARLQHNGLGVEASGRLCSSARDRAHAGAEETMPTAAPWR
jgi:hypothetical protein